jgi:hypothetical protein
LFSLTYVSSAKAAFSARELRELLKVCNRNNRERAVTGMLLYKDGNFMQVLEGAEPVVRGVYHAISRDPRHRSLITLLEREEPQRHFPGWSMGFADLGADVDNNEGHSEFLRAPLTGQEFQSDPSRAQLLLLSFKKHM